MQRNRIKEVMAAGGHALVAYAGDFTGPHIVDLAGRAGFDGVYLDMQHREISLEDFPPMVAAAVRAGIEPVARPPELDPALIARLLDLGVTGIKVPGVRTADHARAAVAAVQDARRDVLLGCIVESVEGVENAEAIAAVEGVDLIAIGPNDLADSLGGTQGLAEGIERIIAAARAHNVPVGLSIMHRAFPRSAAELRALGVRYSQVAPAPEVHVLNGWNGALAEART